MTTGQLTYRLFFEKKDFIVNVKIRTLFRILKFVFLNSIKSEYI